MRLDPQRYAEKVLCKPVGLVGTGTKTNPLPRTHASSGYGGLFIGADYQGMYAEMKELVWLRGVLGKIGRPEDKPSPFFIDSQSAEDIALNPVFHKRSNT